MFNTKKIVGIIIALSGVGLTKTAPWFGTASSRAFFVQTAGVLIACVGIAIFASGLNKKIEKKIRICPHCYKKNDANNKNCRSCKKPLILPTEE